MKKKYLDFNNDKVAVVFLKSTAEEQLLDFNLIPIRFGYWYFFDRADNFTELRIRNFLEQKHICGFDIYDED